MECYILKVSVLAWIMFLLKLEVANAFKFLVVLSNVQMSFPRDFYKQLHPLPLTCPGENVSQLETQPSP